MTTIYNFNPVTGQFLGADMARESPMEPGVFLIPANSTTVEPPACGANEQLIFKEGGWAVEPIPVPEIQPEPVIDLAAEARAQRAPLLTDADIAINKAEDNGLDSSNLRKYRQALRDITKQQSFPTKITWPEIPS